MDKRVSQFLADAKRVSLTEAEYKASFAALQHATRGAEVSSILDAADTVRMTKRERSMGKKALRALMNARPMPKDDKPSLIDLMLRSTFHLRVGLASILIISILVTTGGSVAYAAESALPGDLLYPVKTEVTEPLWERLQFTPERKAAWIQRRIERRLEESEHLVVRGTFTGEHREHIQSRMQYHARRLENRLEHLESVEGEAAERIREHMEQALERHTQILSGLEEGTLEPEELRTFIQNVHEHKKRFHGRRGEFLQKHPEVRGQLREHFLQKPPRDTGSRPPPPVRVWQHKQRQQTSSRAAVRRLPKHQLPLPVRDMQPVERDEKDSVKDEVPERHPDVRGMLLRDRPHQDVRFHDRIQMNQKIRHIQKEKKLLRNR